MRFNLIRAGMVAAATILSVPAAGAQTWYAAPTPSNSGTGAFWNNRSADNTPGSTTAVCNIGAVLMGMAVNADCIAEVPAGMLPLSNVQALPGSGTRGSFLGNSPMSAASFEFGAGTFRWDLYGKIAGSAFNSVPRGTNPRIGYYEYSSLGARILTEFTNTAGNSQQFQTSGRWGFWVGAVVPNAPAGMVNLYFSDMSTCVSSNTITSCSATGGAPQQFALFTSSATRSVTSGMVNSLDQDRFWLGAEDNAVSGDRDYQDVVGSFTQLPEPASIALFGTGLLGVLAVGRRRKAAK